MDARMVIKADAKAMGAVTALSIHASDRWTPSKPKQRKYDGRKFSGTSDCISYYADDKSDAKVFRTARAERKAATRHANADAPKRYNRFNQVID